MKEKIGNKGNLDSGYIYVPYIIKELPTLIEDASKEWVRRMEIKRRNIKIQKIINRNHGMGS